MRRQHGTIEAIERLVQSDDIQSGFKRLQQLNLLEWTIEAERGQSNCQPWRAVDLFFGLQGESPENGSFPGFGWRLSGIF
jgi:hypothetical protein